MKDLPFAKPKRKPTGKRPATKAERDFMRRVAELGCIITGYKDPPHTEKSCRHVTIHHDTQGGAYRNHYRIIPIQDWLHLIQAGGKASFHGDEKGWQEKHGSIKSLLIKTYERLLNDGGLPEPAMEIYEELKEAQEKCG